MLHAGVLMVMTANVFERHCPELQVLTNAAIPLPADAVMLGPILDLRPHSTYFDEPVLLIFPVCIGATKAWRSSDDGRWEHLTDAEFRAGHAILRLDHFCQVVVGTDGQAQAPILISCYMNDSFHAKWAITHAGCSRCAEAMQAAFQEELVLKNYRLCEEPLWAGVYGHMESLDLAWQWPEAPPEGPKGPKRIPKHLDPEPGSVNFERFPLVSKKWMASGHAVELFIQDHRDVRHCEFCGLARQIIMSIN